VTSPVVVTVLDTDGAPKVGVQVMCENAAHGIGCYVNTNAQGQATLNVDNGGTYRFFVQLTTTRFYSGALNHCAVPGCSTASITVNKPVAVTVTDQAGTPQPSLYVTALDANNGNATYVYTNAQGVATIYLPTQSWRFNVIVDATTFWSGAVGHCTVPGCLSASIVVQPPVLVTVVDTDGTPQVNTLVNATNAAGSIVKYAYTNASGVASLRIVPDAYNFQEKPQDYWFTSGAAGHCVVPGCTAATITQSKPVVVTVRDGDGALVANKSVVATSTDSYTSSSRNTDANGTASFILPLNSHWRFQALCSSTSYYSGAAGHCALPSCLTADVTLTTCGQCAGHANGSACNDANSCTTGDHCQDNVCVSTPVTCTAQDQCHDAGTCNPADGACSNPAKANDTPCNDSDACTLADTCQSGACTGASHVTCTASDQCHTAGQCNHSNGTCSNPLASDGTTCNDGDPQTANDACLAGACTGTPASNPCANKSDYEFCDDGNACTNGEYCQSGVCGGGTPKICNPGGDECQNSCNPATGACTGQTAPDGASCEDGDVCTTGDTCHAGHCGAGGPVECAPPVACYGPGICDPAFGGCYYPQLSVGTSCDDQNACTESATCDSTVICFEDFCFEDFGCKGHDPVTCSPSNDCRVASCDPATGSCGEVPKTNGVTCSDNDSCTQVDTCQGGACIGASPIVCEALDSCHTAGTCNPATGSCGVLAKADGASCDDGSSCTSGDTCHGGVCSGTEQANCGLVVPPIDRTIATDFASATSFLFAGPNAVQTGVAQGTIDPLRQAVIRGRVVGTDGASLAGVTIDVLGHPELGSTSSRSDGMFDLAANGGGSLTLEYRQTGRLTAQRQVQVPTRDYVVVPEVVLVALDPEMTIVQASSSYLQIARGSVVSDADGSRQATLIVPPNTSATVVHADGSTTPLSQLSVRATEFTVGDRGPAAMPAPLPPQTAYTYAVEYSVDEALGPDDVSVQFDQPVLHYVENFIGFPVGTPVPTGYYDRVRATWVPSDNGKVIKVLEVFGGLAELDTDGDAVADDSATLAALGVTDAERLQLALLYLPGQSLWRVPISHFTPWDCNWTPPFSDDPEPPKAKKKDEEDDPCKKKGSIIDCENQVLGETFPVVGTPFALNYSSQRTFGYHAASQVLIPLGDSINPRVNYIDVTVSVAGRQFSGRYSPTPGQQVEFDWDGLDAYGRQPQGPQNATIDVAYSYSCSYLMPGSLPRTFGQATDQQLEVNRYGRQCPQVETQELLLGAWDQKDADKLGGWALSVHHTYDPASRHLYLGTGDVVTASKVDALVSRFMGTGVQGSAPDGTPAKNAPTNFPSSVEIGPDGTAYVLTNGEVQHIDRAGIMHIVAGAGPTPAIQGDGLPATQVTFFAPMRMSVGADGSIYVLALVDVVVQGIWRITPDGIVRRIAGAPWAGGATQDGDGGPALAAHIDIEAGEPGMAVGADGSIALWDQYFIRKITPDGIIDTVAGGGERLQAQNDQSPDGTPAKSAYINIVDSVAIDATGQIYFISYSAQVFSIPTVGYPSIRTIGTDGVLRSIVPANVRSPGCDSPVDGPAVTQILRNPRSLRFGPDGKLYFAEFCSDQHTGPNAMGQVRRIDSDGIIRTVFGTGQVAVPIAQSTSDTMAAHAWPMRVDMLAVGRDSMLFKGVVSGHRYGDNLDVIFQYTPAIPGPTGEDIRLPSSDARDVFVFDKQGRHLRTEDARTGAVRLAFGYDTAGRLSSITNIDGLVTTIERDTSGEPSAIVSPTGQRTGLTTDPNGYLASITNPAMESTTLMHAPDGLLRSESDPKGNQHTFDYDPQGLLLKDSGPAGGSSTLVRSEGVGEVGVSVTSAEGRRTAYGVQGVNGLAEFRTMVRADGLSDVISVDSAGGESYGLANGLLAGTTLAPDPQFGTMASYVTSTLITTPAITYRAYDVRSVTTDPSTGAMTSRTDTLGINSGPTSTVVYDAASRTTTTTTPAGRQSVIRQDDHGRLVYVHPMDKAPTAYTYDVRGRLSTATTGVGPEARIVTLGYDLHDRTNQWTGQISAAGPISHDDAGRMSSVVLGDGSTLGFGYDLNGKLTSLTPPGRLPQTFTYTPANLLESYRPPVVDATTVPTTYEWDRDENLTLVRQPGGRTISMVYDSAGRLETQTYSAGTMTRHYSRSTGLVESATAPGGGTVEFGYDAGMLSSETWSGPITGQVSRHWNQSLLTNDESVNGANTLNYTYDADRLVIGVNDLVLTRDPATSLVTGGGVGAVTDTKSYNQFGEVQDSEVHSTTAQLLREHYERDKLGRIETKVETIGAQVRTFNYSYDVNGRLWQVMIDGTVVATYEYDSNGNRSSKTTPSGTEIGAYDAQDRLQSYGAWTFHYTPNGELDSKTDGNGATTTYQYDELRNLRHVGLPDGRSIDYVIDAENRRIGKKVNGVLTRAWLYGFGLTPVAELDGAGNVVSRIEHGELLIKSGVEYRVISDERSSPRMIIDAASGAVAQAIEYDEFGRVTTDTAPGFQPLGFGGGLYDPDTGLVQLGARDYDAATGRWTIKDPLAYAGYESNAYSYVDDEPINRVDPLGLDFQTFFRIYMQLLLHNYSTPEDMAIFYSGDGNLEKARAWAKCTGKKLMEDTEGGKWLDQQIRDAKGKVSKTEYEVLWGYASALYALAASGDVFTFVDGASPDSIWAQVEKRMLEKFNPFVNKPFIPNCKCK
jgi:RHS repeat-associated protein